MTPRADKLIAALLAFADPRGHWPRCPRTREMARSTMMDADGNTILTPCSTKCRQAREAIEADGGTVLQPPPRVLGPRDRRTLADIFGHLPGCSLIPGAEYHHRGCAHETAGAA